MSREVAWVLLAVSGWIGLCWIYGFFSAALKDYKRGRGN